MTNELENGDHIVDFTSATGPKNCGYKTANGKVCCKVRGFTLNVRGFCQLDYKGTRQNLLDEVADPLEQRRNIPVANHNHGQRDSATNEIRVITHIKQYRIVCDERVVDATTCKS